MSEAGWYPEDWVNPADDPELDWIVPADDDHPDPVPPDDRLADEPETVEVEDTGQNARVAVQLRAPEPGGVARTYVAPGIAGLSLTNYTKLPSAKGWGTACSAARATVKLSQASVTVDARIAELVGLVMRACEARGYIFRRADTGAYNCRYISGTTTWSNHAWALAVDVNWNSNPYTTLWSTDIPGWMHDLWNRYGFAWGGDYTGKHDFMHFEYMGTPQQAQLSLILARAELGQLALKFAVVGRIREAFDRFGGVNRLGQPLGPEVPTTDPAGRWQNFVYGRILWHPNVDRGTAHVVFGEIEKRFNALGYEVQVGWPVTDEMTAPDRVGRFGHFLHGTEYRSIYWTPATGAHYVRGGIRGAWEAQGWEKGIGYPTDEEHPAEGGTVQNFQRGSILWLGGKGTVRRK